MIESQYLKVNKALLETLRAMPAFGPFKETELNSLVNMSKIRKYKPGEQIIRDGHADQWIYFLVYGKVRVEKDGKTLAVLSKRGDVFGEMGVIDGSPRSAAVFAEGEAVCLATNTLYIHKLAGQDKVAFGYVLYRVFAEILAARLRDTSKLLMEQRKKSTFKHLWDRIRGRKG